MIGRVLVFVVINRSICKFLADQSAAFVSIAYKNLPRFVGYRRHQSAVIRKMAALSRRPLDIRKHTVVVVLVRGPVLPEIFSADDPGLRVISEMDYLSRRRTNFLKISFSVAMKAAEPQWGFPASPPEQLPCGHPRKRRADTRRRCWR